MRMPALCDDSGMRPLIAFVFVLGCSSGPSGPPDASTSEAGPSDATMSDAPPSDASAEASVTTDCIAKINAYRAMVAAPPVTSRDDEVACATDQATKGAMDLADSGMTVFHKYFGQCSEQYQNECWYRSTIPTRSSPSSG